MVRHHHVLEPGLVDRDHAALQAFDLGGVDVDAGHGVADFGQAGARHESDITGSEDRNPHSCIHWALGAA
jgi:hypothetical protein